jgi:nitrogen fixation/metabolism regulation signal transduction histidine kinase
MSAPRAALSVSTRIALLAALGAFPGGVTALVLLARTDVPAKVAWSLGALIVVCWVALPLLLGGDVRRRLRTIANLLTALREGDFSLRGRASGSGASADLGGIVSEINILSELLREQRLGALEATALLRRVVAELDVAVFAFDGERRLRLVNRAGERIVGAAAERALGATADELGLAVLLEKDGARTLEASFPGASGAWELRRGSFRQGGRAHDVVVLTDVRRALRDEERLAWQRLVRVLGHEINNSLTPIRSIATQLAELVVQVPAPEDREADLHRGLAVIARRSEALHRFLSSYARLAGLPAPARLPLDVGAWVHRVATLEDRLPVRVVDGPVVVLAADGDQLDQLLINLVKNAVEASLETGGGVEIGWTASPEQLEVVVRDEGPGIADASNLFVPFFTTKQGGSGIGLALSREIAEAHGGSLTLEERGERSGSCARLFLPRT